MKNEWMNLMCKDKEYSVEEAVEKYKEIISFLKDKKIRTVLDGNGIERIVENDEFHLAESDKKTILKKYQGEGYTDDSCQKIIQSIDVVYHYYDVSKEYAESIVAYAANHKMTLSKALQDSMDTLGLVEYTEFINTVLPSLQKMYDAVILRYGSKFVIALGNLLRCKNN